MYSYHTVLMFLFLEEEENLDPHKELYSTVQYAYCKEIRSHVDYLE